MSGKGAVVVAVANRKGGTGKTTTAVNLAAEWAEQGLSTLLVDMDTQGHAAVGLGCRVDRKRTLHHLFSAPDFDLGSAVQETSQEWLWLIPADIDYRAQAHGPCDDQVLRRALEHRGLRQRFDRIILDTPPTSDDLLVNAMAAADGVLVPFVPHHLGLVAVNQLVRLFYRVATRSNPELVLFGLLPVMYDRHIRLHRSVVDEVRDSFGSGRVLRGIRGNVKLAEAFAKGQPVRRHAPRSAGTMDYRLLSEALNANWSSVQESMRPAVTGIR